MSEELGNVIILPVERICRGCRDRARVCEKLTQLVRVVHEILAILEGKKR